MGALVTGGLVYAGNGIADAGRRRYEVRITWDRLQGPQALGRVQNVSDHDLVGLAISSGDAEANGDIDSTSFVDAQFPGWADIPRQARVLHPREEQPFTFDLAPGDALAFPIALYVNAFPAPDRPRGSGCAFTQRFGRSTADFCPPIERPQD